MINNVTLMGRLTADPELRTTTTGRNVTSFSIAVDNGYARAVKKDRPTLSISLHGRLRPISFVVTSKRVQ